MRDEVVDYVTQWSSRTELSATRLVKWIGVGLSKFYDWRKRHGKVNEHNRLVGGFVRHYSHERLHSAIGYARAG